MARLRGAVLTLSRTLPSRLAVGCSYEVLLPCVGLVCCGIVRHGIQELNQLSKSRWVKLRKDKQRIEPLKVQMWFFNPNGVAKCEVRVTSHGTDAARQCAAAACRVEGSGNGAMCYHPSH